jgi:hypothetical protein
MDILVVHDKLGDIWLHGATIEEGMVGGIVRGWGELIKEEWDIPVYMGIQVYMKFPTSCVQRIYEETERIYEETE